MKMHIVRGWHNLKRKPYNPATAGSVVTLGNFDGVHVGHQALIDELKKTAHALSLQSTVVLFEPHPKAFFDSANRPAVLTPLAEKLRLLAKMGVDRVVCLAFNQALSQLPAEDFVRDFLVRDLRAKHIIIGDDFRFGYQRAGDIHLLHQLASLYDFTVTTLPTCFMQEQRVSSSRIRHLLAQGDCEAAGELLGSFYHLSGVVRHGDKRGRTLGYPTANLTVHPAQLAIPYGIYAVTVAGFSSEILPGVASLGVRPTLQTEPVLWLEVHLFDFNKSLYGKRLTVYFLHRLRDELAFASLPDLVVQMQKDEVAARKYLKKPKK